MIALLLSSSSLPLLDGAAYAQSAADKRKAKRLYRNAERAAESKDFEEAVALYQEAYELDPNPEALYDIGLAYRELGKYAEAESTLTRYLQEQPGASNSDQVRELIFELQQLMAVQTASVTIDAPDGVEVYVNEEPEPRCTAPCVVALTPGFHQVTIQGEGVKTEVKEIDAEPAATVTLGFLGEDETAGAKGQLVIKADVSGAELYLDGRPRATLPMTAPLELEVGVYPAALVVGGEQRWTGSLVIKPDEVTETTVTLKEEAPASSGGGSGAMTIAAYALWGAGLASLGAGAFFGLAAADAESKLDGQLDAQQDPDQDLVDTGESQALMANVFFGVALVAVGTGVALYLLDDSGAPERARGADEAEAGSIEVQIAPTGDGGVVGVGVSF